MKKPLSIVALVIFLLNGIALKAQVTIYFYIAMDGKASNDGTKEKPFATLQSVIDKLQTQNRGTYASVIIEFADGYYGLESSKFSPHVNGAMDTKITIRAANQGKSILSTGKKIPISEFSKITDFDDANRIQPHLRDSIVAIKLSDFEIANVRQFFDVFEGDGGLVQLFFDEERMPLAQYPNPNDQSMTIAKVLVNGGGQEKPGSWSDFYQNNLVRRQLEIKPPRPGVFTFNIEHQEAHARWERALQQNIPIWVNGFWRVMWENSSIRVANIDLEAKKLSLAVPITGGVGSKYHRPGGSGKEVYKVVNLLEEIDYPGEWSFDFASQQLFFYPPELTGTVVIAHNNSPVLSLDYVSDVKLEGLVIEGSLGNGIEITGGKNNEVLGCIIRRLGNDGIVIDGGFEHKVRSSDLYDLGGGGIWLSGGMEDTTPRIAANHQIINNYIHHFAKVRKVYAAGINCGFTGGGGGGHVPAVGNRIAHNLIHTTPHVGMLHGSFDNVFEYNEVYDWANVSNDMGALYCYSHYPYINNTIVRYNFFHSSAEGDGIYFDHNMQGAEVYGNLLFNIGNDEEKGRGTAYLIKNGDKDHDRDRFKMYNNIAIDCKTSYYARVLSKDDFFNNISVQTKKIDFQLYYQEDLDEAAIKNPDILLKNNRAYKKNIGFYNIDEVDFRLKTNSVLFKELEGFEMIPYEKMGLYVDEYRGEVKNHHRNLTYLRGFTKGKSAYEVEDRN